MEVNFPGSSSDNVDIEILKVMECPICAKIFEEPKQLNCGHSFCNDCCCHLLVDSQTSNDYLGLGGNHGHMVAIRCPICRHITSVPENGLSTNYVLLDLIERLCNRNSSIQKCGNCERSLKNETILYCETCSNTATSNVILCAMCAINNHAKPGHNVLPAGSASELHRKKVEELLHETINFCTLHLQETLVSVDSCETELNKIPDMLVRRFKQLEDIENSIKSFSLFSKETMDEKMREIKIANQSFSELNARCLDVTREIFTKISDLADDVRAILDSPNSSAQEVGDSSYFEYQRSPFKSTLSKRRSLLAARRRLHFIQSSRINDQPSTSSFDINCSGIFSMRPSVINLGD